jgi:GTP-binding protein LepA
LRTGVEVPQEAFVAALATDADIEKVKAARK